MPLKIAVDAMGADLGPQIVVSALAGFLSSNPTSQLLLFGNQLLLSSLLSKTLDGALAQRVEVCHSADVVSGTDKPSSALRTKHNSSMAMAIKAVADGKADICVSGGNTGAMMALGISILGTLTNISRPAICAEIPTKNGRCLLLDLGANVDCSALQLSQFAALGAQMATKTMGLEFPSVRLLSIGTEPLKGNRLIKQTDNILRANSEINYQGFIEGNKVFAGEANVVVCDGFSGNVALKMAEGVANLIACRVKQQVSHGWVARLLAWLFKARLSQFKRSINPALYNGAFLLGLKGTMIKSHGAADTSAFRAALDMAVNYSRSVQEAES